MPEVLTQASFLAMALRDLTLVTNALALWPLEKRGRTNTALPTSFPHVPRGPEGCAHVQGRTAHRQDQSKPLAEGQTLATLRRDQKETSRTEKPDQPCIAAWTLNVFP